MFRKKDGPPADQAAPREPAPTGSSLRAKVETANSKAGSPVTAISGKQAYEARRAEKAGMGLEKWMAEKDRRVQAEREALQRAQKVTEPRKPGLLRRLLDRAHRPI